MESHTLAIYFVEKYIIFVSCKSLTCTQQQMLQYMKFCIILYFIKITIPSKVLNTFVDKGKLYNLSFISHLDI